MNQENNRVLDWTIFVTIYLILLGGIGWAASTVYGNGLGLWVIASAAIAGCTSLYLFHVEVSGEVLMKIILVVSVAANAGYLVHNGAVATGAKLYNDAQIQKYEKGMAAAARAQTVQVARALGMSARNSANLERAFGDDVAVVASILAFIELALGLVIFAIASSQWRRIQSRAGNSPRPKRYVPADEPDEFTEWEELVDEGQPVAGKSRRR